MSKEKWVKVCQIEDKIDQKNSEMFKEKINEMQTWSIRTVTNQMCGKTTNT